MLAAAVDFHLREHLTERLEVVAGAHVTQCAADLTVVGVLLRKEEGKRVGQRRREGGTAWSGKEQGTVTGLQHLAG